MEVTFINPGQERILAGILETQTDDSTPFWSDSLYYFYPELNKEYAFSLKAEERKKYIQREMGKIYMEKKGLLDEKVEEYTKSWLEHKEQITSALSDAFEIDCKELLNDLVCYVSLNPVSPRFLQEHAFEIFYLNSGRGAIGVAIHEIIHFVWFYVWNQVYGDSYEEYETPSLKWIFSEMIVESIMRDERLSAINPYFPRENGGCIYPYFFSMEVDGKLILETLDEMYRGQSIKDFMKNGYEYCIKHEEEIREHIRKSEQNA